MSLLYEVLWNLGNILGCHQMPERSFFISGKQFPVCARCTGAFIGYFIGGLTYAYFKIPIILAVSFCIILFIDWLIQRLKIRESTNFRRFVTGVFCGFSLVQLYYNFIVFVISQIGKL
jgi:uncharacterized membrane protein